MKKQIILFIALLWGGLGYAQKRESGSLVLENIPEASAQMLERLDQYQNVRNATFADWDTKGEGILIATRFLWRCAADSLRAAAGRQPPATDL